MVWQVFLVVAWSIADSDWACKASFGWTIPKRQTSWRGDPGLPAPWQDRLRHSHTARTRCPTWFIIPLVVLGTFSRRSEKKTFMWLKNPPAVAHKSPPCGSKIPSMWLKNPPLRASKIPLGTGRQGWRGGIARFTEGTCGSLASRPRDGPAALHANFTDSVVSGKAPVSRRDGKTIHGRQNPRHFAIISRRLAPLDEKWGEVQPTPET